MRVYVVCVCCGCVGLLCVRVCVMRVRCLYLLCVRVVCVLCAFVCVPCALCCACVERVCYVVCVMLCVCFLTSVFSQRSQRFSYRKRFTPSNVTVFVVHSERKPHLKTSIVFVFTFLHCTPVHYTSGIVTVTVISFLFAQLLHALHQSSRPLITASRTVSGAEFGMISERLVSPISTTMIRFRVLICVSGKKISG